MLIFERKKKKTFLWKTKNPTNTGVNNFFLIISFPKHVKYMSKTKPLFVPPKKFDSLCKPRHFINSSFSEEEVSCTALYSEYIDLIVFEVLSSKAMEFLQNKLF